MIDYLRLDHIQLCIPTDKESETREFYTKTPGLREIPKPKELLQNRGIWFQLADLKEAREHLEKYLVKIKEEICLPDLERFSFFDPFWKQDRIAGKNQYGK